MIAKTKEEIEYVHLATLKSAIKLESIGMKRRGRSAYSIAKSKYGFRGNRESVMRQIGYRMSEIMGETVEVI